MATCTYCGGSITAGIDTCPHCGGDLTAKGQHEIKIETRGPFVLKAISKRSYIVRKLSKAFIVFPLIVPGIIVLEVMGLFHGQNLTTLPLRIQLVFGGLILFSAPLCFYALLNTFSNRAKKNKWTISENEIECVVKGTTRVFLLSQVASVDCLQTDFQKKYETGDIRLVLKNIGYIIFRDADDYVNNCNRVKKYVALAQSEGK
jgi:hypothetical protein